MKVEHLKRLPALIVSALLLLASLGTVSANQPYFKTYGGDVMTGGWYKSGNSCPAQSSGYYQDSNYPQGGADIRNGGILTYARVNNNVSYLQTNGASSQYAAFSLGSIDGDATQNDGFNSAGAQAATTPTFPWALAFSNNHSGNTWGGLYEGNVRQSNCIPDYFGTKQNSPQSCCNITAYGDSIDLNNADGQYLMTPSSGSNAVINPAGIAIPAGKHITVFVKGNAYIPSNITYAPHNANNVPKFSLVASGSIYIDPAVTQLDGVYIAEPATNDANTINADDGTIWTCHPNNSLTLDYFYPPTCTNPLLVNGAFIAKQVNFLRVKGDITTPNPGEDSINTFTAPGGSCTPPAPATCNVAEIINYTPDVIMGGSFFSGSTSSNSAAGLPVDSITSLPPVF